MKGELTITFLGSRFAEQTYITKGMGKVYIYFDIKIEKIGLIYVLSNYTIYAHEMKFLME